MIANVMRTSSDDEIFIAFFGNYFNKNSNFDSQMLLLVDRDLFCDIHILQPVIVFVFICCGR